LRSGSLVAVAMMAVGSACAQGPQHSGDLVLKGGRVIASPAATEMENATVVLHDGKIVAVGTKVKIPAGATVIDCKGDTIVAGFWNSHVHFTEAVWSGAEKNPVGPMQAHLEEMLTRWGFVTVWDLGSDPSDTPALRKRIEAGELRGPRIFMAGDIFPKGGHPVYLPAEMQLPEASTREEAAGMANFYLTSGFDGIKLFTGAYMGEGHPVVNMDTAIAKAAVDVAHAAGKPVFTHPQNYAGVDNALAAGVDILAHTIPNEKGYTAEELARMKAQKTALIPTLALWRAVMEENHATPEVMDGFIQRGADELKSFAAQGGTVLFGTDVGFQKEYDTTHEMEYMGRALGWKEILASLTTNPCDFFKREHCGRVEVGDDGDVVVLTADPAADVKNFAKVAYTVRGGRVIYSAK